MIHGTRGMRTGALAVAVLVLLAGCFSERGDVGPDLSTCDVRLPPDLLGTTIVAIRNFTFEPAVVHVAAGERVTWVNCAPADEPAHTATSDTGVWASPLFATGSFYSRTFTEAGSFPYHCEPHPFMKATVVVR